MSETDEVRIIWHIGPQKTGTRTVQTWINANHSAFARHSALFVKHSNAYRLENAGKRILRPGRLLRSRWLREMRLRLAVEEVRNAAAQHPSRTALVSNENMIGHWICHEEISLLDEAAAVMPLLVRFATPARSHFVFYTRSMGPWLKSAWRQEVMVRRGTADFESWRKMVPFGEDWGPIKERLDAVAHRAGASISFGDFEAEIAAGQLGRAILDQVPGASALFETTPQTKATNKGAGASATEFMLRLNRTEIDPAAREIVRRTIEANRDLFDPDRA